MTNWWNVYLSILGPCHNKPYTRPVKLAEATHGIILVVTVVMAMAI